jgi:hypothetical protein
MNLWPNHIDLVVNFFGGTQKAICACERQKDELAVHNKLNFVSLKGKKLG